MSEQLALSDLRESLQRQGRRARTLAVLVATATARATMDESDWLLERAVEGRPALAARHGATATELVEARIERRIPVEVAEAIRYGHALRRMGWGHEEVFHVLGEAETLPAAAAYLSVLAFDRIMVGHMYDLPEDFMEDTIQRAIPAHAGLSPVAAARRADDGDPAAPGPGRPILARRDRGGRGRSALAPERRGRGGPRGRATGAGVGEIVVGG